MSFTGLNSRISYANGLHYGSTNCKSQKSGESYVGMLKCVRTSE